MQRKVLNVKELTTQSYKNSCGQVELKQCGHEFECVYLGCSCALVYYIHSGLRSTVAIRSTVSGNEYRVVWLPQRPAMLDLSCTVLY